VRVRSVNRIGADGALLEFVGGVFFMRLGLFEVDGALHFRSPALFLPAGALAPGPTHLLSPGIAHIVHTDLARAGTASR